MAPLTLAIGKGALSRGIKAAGALPDGTPVSIAEVEPIHRAFAPMAREGRYDVSEMAIVTALQALAWNKPIVLLPVTLAARFQHKCLIRLSCRPELTPGGLRGRRVGVRAYTQTTGMWVRAIHTEATGLPVEAMRWATQEGAHVAEYQDPPCVERLPEGSLPELLRDGTLDAAILGNDLPDGPDFAPVFAEPDATARSWFARTGIVPINHLLVVRRDIAATRTAEIAALIAALREAKPTAEPDLLPMGEAAMDRSMAAILDTCFAQGLLPRRIAPEEAFAEARGLGLG
jgi:4,5-dihydroxyphthalate decarboxylase